MGKWKLIKVVLFKWECETNSYVYYWPLFLSAFYEYDYQKLVYIDFF